MELLEAKKLEDKLKYNKRESQILQDAIYAQRKANEYRDDGFCKKFPNLYKTALEYYNEVFYKAAPLRPLRARYGFIAAQLLLWNNDKLMQTIPTKNLPRQFTDINIKHKTYTREIKEIFSIYHTGDFYINTEYEDDLLYKKINKIINDLIKSRQDLQSALGNITY